jgi:tRNA (guanine-N7-)-methyltransferase
VIESYGLTLHEDSNDVNKGLSDNKALQIRTHYESLDIAKSNRVHYLKFSIIDDLDTSKDDWLLEQVKLIEKKTTDEQTDYETN